MGERTNLASMMQGSGNWASFMHSIVAFAQVEDFGSNESRVGGEQVFLQLSKPDVTSSPFSGPFWEEIANNMYFTSGGKLCVEVQWV